MITNFKLFENVRKVNKPIYKIGDIVYTITGKKGKIIKVHRGYYNDSLDVFEPHRYLLDILPHLAIREDVLRSEIEVNSEKYNL